jgi:hypothetical protein
MGCAFRRLLSYNHRRYEGESMKAQGENLWGWDDRGGFQVEPGAKRKRSRKQIEKPVGLSSKWSAHSPKLHRNTCLLHHPYTHAHTHSCMHPKPCTHILTSMHSYDSRGTPLPPKAGSTEGLPFRLGPNPWPGPSKGSIAQFEELLCDILGSLLHLTRGYLLPMKWKPRMKVTTHCICMM